MGGEWREARCGRAGGEAAGQSPPTMPGPPLVVWATTHPTFQSDPPRLHTALSLRRARRQPACDQHGMSRDAARAWVDLGVWVASQHTVTRHSVTVQSPAAPKCPSAPVRGARDDAKSPRWCERWLEVGGQGLGASHKPPFLENSILLLVRSRFLTFHSAISGGVAEERARLLARARHRPERTMVLSPPTATAGTSLSHLPFERGVGGTGPGQWDHLAIPVAPPLTIT